MKENIKTILLFFIQSIIYGILCFSCKPLTFAKKVAKGIKAATGCKRVGVAVLGMEVNDVHVHLVPMNSEKDMLFTNPKLSLPAEEMAFIANSIAEAIDKQ